MALTYTQHYTKFTCKILHLADFSTFTSNVICIFFPQVSAIPYLILDSVLMWHGKQAWHKYTVCRLPARLGLTFGQNGI